MNDHRNDRYYPSPIELGGLRKELETFNAYMALRLSRYILPAGISTPLARAVSCNAEALEHVQIQQSEASDRTEL